jgi:3-hydroxyacyl-CoA dehydrogenase
MSERARIGFIGLGVMGSRMAATLARARHSMVVHDVDPVTSLGEAHGVTPAAARAPAFVTFVLGEAGQALELRFIRGFDDADEGRFTRAADR